MRLKGTLKTYRIAMAHGPGGVKVRKVPSHPDRLRD